MNKKILAYFILSAILILKIGIVPAQTDTFSIVIDAKKNTGPFVPLWSYLAMMKRIIQP